MSYDVTSWFVSQLELRSSEPKRYFFISGSDYSDKVTKWPKFKRTANRVIASKATISLANDDGEMNFFHERLYTMPNTCSVKVGFTHPQSGDELITIFSGDIKEVKYPRKQTCQLNLRDRLWALAEKKIGDSDAKVTFSSQIPSEIAWTICTCYGELDNTQSSANVHIDYDTFLEWAGQFSANNVEMAADYDGQKVNEALIDLGEMSDSAIWTDGNGKINFKRYTEPSSLDFVLTPNELLDVVIKVDGLNIINKAWVYGDYAVESDYWQINAFAQDTTAVNTYGLHENIWKNEHIWYVDSVSCLNLASRMTWNYKYPPKKFNLKTTVVGLHREIGETVRFVDSFYNVTSGSGWRFSEISIDVNNFKVEYGMNQAYGGRAFFLDYSSLDSSDLLL